MRGAQKLYCFKGTNMSLRFEPLVCLVFFRFKFLPNGFSIFFQNGEKLVFWEFFS
jgi:hypothetical protein